MKDEREGMDKKREEGRRTMTRREFLRRAFWVGAAGLAYNYGLFASELTRGGRSIGRTTGAPRIAIPTVCRMCPARCGILAFLEDGILVKIEGNPKDPNARGGICSKGLSALQFFLNPDRLLTPLRRVGPRGSGKFEPLSWDEALGELASRLGEIRASNPERFLFLGNSQGIDPLIERFLRAFGGPTVGISRSLWGTNRAEAWKLTWGEDSYIPDLARTKYILNFGANPYETGEMYVPLVRRLVEGRRGGAKLVTFDPRLSRTAGKSDEWFPLRPGTDAAVALAMANVIVQLGLYDRDFFELRSNWRIERLAEHLRPSTPERAEEISGVKAGHIRRIAVEFARTHPAVVLTGGGLSKHENGVQNERSVFLLAALTGNLERRGGLCLPRRYDLRKAEPEPRPTGEIKIVPAQELFPRISRGELEAGLLWVDRANPAFDHPEPQVVQEVLRDEEKVPFVVVSDTFRSETAELADLVLPAATFLESWELHSPPGYDLVPYLILQQPVMPPVGEARPVAEVVLGLATRLGGELARFFPFSTVEAYIEKQLETLPELAQSGGLEYLKEHGFWAPPAHPEYGRPFPTPSRRLEIYSSALGTRQQPALPTYLAPTEHRPLEEGEFRLVIFESALHNGTPTAQLWWLMEIEHDNPIWINKEVAERLGLSRGDRVRLISKSGTIEGKSFPTQGIHPEVVAIHAGLGHWGLGRLARGGAFRSRDPNTQLIWWEEAGVHVQPLIPVRSDPVGRGQAWQDTVVRLARVHREGGRE